MTPKQVLEMAKEKSVKVVDIRFMDFPGVWQHFSVPLHELEESSFEDGFGFDGPMIISLIDLRSPVISFFSALVS